MRRLGVAIGAVVVLSLSACAGDDPATLRIYTSVTQGTVDSVVDGFSQQFPDLDVEVFRAPTGEVAARIATEKRTGGVRADVLWLTDPLSMQQYEADGMLRAWTPVGAESIPAELAGESFWGARILTMVMVVRDGVPAPERWEDLTDARFEGGVAFPDPGFAGSSFAVLGYFAATDGYGMEFYERLAANGAIQVRAPGEVVTGVAEGRFDAGITLRFSAANAVEDGSPISIVWPSGGAIALYSPIAVTEGGSVAAEAFVEFVLGDDGQQRIADTGWQPVRGDYPVGGDQVTVDWAELFGRQQELLAAYRGIFEG